MRVLIDGRLYSQRTTGIARYTKELVSAYEHYFGGENVYVLVNRGQDQVGSNLVRTRLKPFNLLHFALLSVRLWRLKFDVFHSPFYASSAFKRRGTIYILTVHDMMYRVVDEFFANKKLLRLLAVAYFDRIVFRSIRIADHVISVSRTTQEDMRRILRRESLVIIEGINDLSPSPCSPPRIELQSGEFFLYVGNSRPHKNLAFLDAAMKFVHTERKLILCGTSNTYFSSDPRVLNIGAVEDGQLRWLYANCACFVMPSLYEGFGMPVLEALSLGAKVVASRGGALSEFDDNVVLRYDDDDPRSLGLLLDRIQDVQPDMTATRNLLSGYTWEKAREQLYEAFDKWGIKGSVS